MTPNSSVAKSLPCQLYTLPLSSDPNPLPFCSPHPYSLLVQACLSQELGSRRRGGRGTKEWVFFSPAPPPRAPGAEGFLVSSLEQGTQPALPGPTPDILGSAFPWKLGGSGVDMFSVCLCNWGVFMYLRMFVALGLCSSVFVSFLVFIDEGAQVGSRSELGTDGTKVSMCVFLCVREDPLATCLSGCMCKRIIFPVYSPI